MPSLDGLSIRTVLNSRERLTAHQIVRDTLRHAILSGTLPGGTRLVQAEIAAHLQVSTTPVREALRDLASDELIRFHPHRGAVVRELDMEELTEIYEIRKALEPLAIRLAAQKITPQELKVAAAVQRQMDKERDPGSWVDLNRKFHGLLEDAAHSPRLASFVKTVQDSSALYVAHSVQLDSRRITEGNSDHRRILAALRAGDGERAATVLWQHLESTLKAILAANDGSHASAQLSRRRATADRGATGAATTRRRSSR